MSGTTSGVRALAPYQTEFVIGLLKDYRRGAIYLLVGPVGMGKTVATAEATARLLASAKIDRLLVLCPAPLVEQWTQQLKSAGVPAVGLRPETYRLLREDLGITGSIPSGAYVVSIDFAKRADVSAQLRHTPWDLLVADEAHGFSGQRERVIQDLRSLGDSALLLLTATPTAVLDAFGAVATRFDWYGSVAQHVAAVTAEGLTAVRTVLTTYARTPEERALLLDVAQLAPLLPPFSGQTLLRRAASSLNALELFLIRLGSASDISSESAVTTKAILSSLEGITTDAQLRCALDTVRNHAPAPNHTVIFTDFADTARYLVGAFTDLTRQTFLLHGGLEHAEQRRVYDAFRTGGGVLISTSVAAAGSSMAFVEVVVHYDLPATMRGYAQREGRYRRFGRTVGCTAHLLADESDLLGTKTTAGKLLNADLFAAPPEQDNDYEGHET